MQSFVVGNVTIDTTLIIQDFPEAGTSIHGREVAVGLGGKGCNQSIVLARAGVATTLIAAIGDDVRGALIRQRLGSEPVQASVVEMSGVASDASLILSSAGGDNANITTSSCAEALTSERAIAAMAQAQAGDLLVLQGNLADDTTLSLLQFGRARGLVTAFNPSPLRDGMGMMLPWVDIVFLNEVETLAIAGLREEAAALALLGMGPRQVVLTMGGAGSILATEGGVLSVPAVPCLIVDTTGAGDTFMATALASAALRESPLDGRAMADAAAAAALTVSRMGTQAAFPTANEMTDIFGRAITD